jgi:hypothetical protein
VTKGWKMHQSDKESTNTTPTVEGMETHCCLRRSIGGPFPAGMDTTGLFQLFPK